MEGPSQLYTRWLATLKRYRHLLLSRSQGEEAEIYDEVTEDQYKSVVQDRLAKDDFVIDDGVGDYLDNGMDDWENDDARNDSEDEAMYKTSMAHLSLVFIRPDFDEFPTCKAKPKKVKSKAQTKSKPPPP